jgi:RecA-family ATPase
MNFENIGLEVAKVINDNKKKDNEKILSVEDDEDKVKDYFEEYKCLKGERMQQIPIKQRERDVLFISGQSGSGKSTYSRKYIEQYHKMYKKRPVFVFSYFQDDPSLDSLKYLKRIPLDEKFVNTELVLEDFRDTLVLFDDIDCIRNKEIRTKLFNILHSLLELARHVNCTVLYLSHLSTKGHETRTILNECGSVTIFPKNMNSRAFKYLLETYFGLDKAQIKRIKQLRSRAITIVKTYPNIVIYEGGCYVLKCDD